MTVECISLLKKVEVKGENDPLCPVFKNLPCALRITSYKYFITIDVLLSLFDKYFKPFDKFMTLKIVLQAEIH